MSRTPVRPSARSSARGRNKSLAKARSLSKSAKTRGRITAIEAPALGTSGDRGLTAFGERLVSTLQSKGMSDSELAKALGIAQPNIHTLKYKTDRPRHKTVVKIAKALGVSPEVLLPQANILGAQTAAEGTKVYLVIESKQGRQTIRLA